MPLSLGGVGDGVVVVWQRMHRYDKQAFGRRRISACPADVQKLEEVHRPRRGSLRKHEKKYKKKSLLMRILVVMKQQRLT